MNRFFVDCETDGLYGLFLSIAAMVTDEQGDERDCFYGAVQPESVTIHDEWVQKNVAPHLAKAETFFPDEESLLDAFWSFWMKWREEADCIADVPCPVEARLFARCVERDVSQRSFCGPYPLYDLATLLLARGLDPLADRDTLTDSQLVRHDAMDDVRMTAQLWNGLVRRQSSSQMAS